MLGRAYTVFDTAIGRCGIVWGDAGVVGVQLPEAREIETRRRLFQLYPEARETRPARNVEIGDRRHGRRCCAEQTADFAEVALDMGGIHVFDQRVYQITRRIPRGETRTYGEIAARLGASGAVRFGRPGRCQQSLYLIVPCHRVLETGGYADQISPNGGLISKRRLLSIEGTGVPRARPCSTCCCRLPRRGCPANFPHMIRTTLLQAPLDLGVRFPLYRGTRRQAVHGTVPLSLRSPLCARAVSAAKAAAGRTIWCRDRSWSAIPATNMSAPTTTRLRRRMPVVLSRRRNWSRRSATERDALAGRRRAAAA